MNYDFFTIALRNISKRKLRSFLTVLGIIIGVAALISLMLVGLGLDSTIREQFEKVGTNRIYIVMKGGGLVSLAEGLTERDAEVLERVQEFSYVTPYLMQVGTKVEYGKEKIPLTIIGYPSEDADKRFEGQDITLSKGRYFNKGEKNVVIIGDKVAHDIFEKDVTANNQIKIKGKRLKVIGIFDPIGNAQDDSSLFMPMDDAREILNKKDEVSVIEVLMHKGVNIDNTVKKAERVLERERGTDDFDILTPDQILGQLASVTSIVQIVLLGIAAISTIVGALGIMNSMYTAVLERRVEIGIMKSIGATNLTIRTLFMIEAGIIGLIGGGIGIMLGISIAKAVQYIATASGVFALVVTVVPWVVISGLVFGVGVGILAGYLPAKQAAKLQPADALRK